jgi:hypothetical protein
MLEILTRRRIIVFLSAVSFVILSLLFFSRIIPSYSKYPPINPEDQQETSDCYLTEPVDVLTFCQKCTSYERRLNPNACSLTGYKESVLCSKSNLHTARSCRIPISVQRQHFWLFEGLTLILGMLAIANVQSRQKTLDKQMAEKIKRQIGESDE